MRKQLDETLVLIKQHNISPPREKNPDEETQFDNGHERCHALKA